MTSPSSTTEKFLEQIKDWPKSPGVYIMRDASERILYVGKAKNLRNRIRSYFQKVDALSGKTRLLVRKISSIEFTVTATELEALLLECNLIKKHRPRYNIRLKDDKNYPYVVIDFTHPFPQFRIARKVVMAPNLKYFGPFSAGVQEIGRFLLKTFQIRDCSDAKFKNRTRPCLNYEIGICTAPCVDYVTQENYGEQIRDAILFLRGKKQELIGSIKKEMLVASEKMQFEQAKTLRDKIRAIEKLTEKQNAVLTEKFKDIDIIGVYPAKNEIQWVVMFVRAGILTGRRSEKTPFDLDSLEESVSSFLEQFYTVSLIPDEVWLAADFPAREEIEKYLTVKGQKRVHVRIPRGEKPMRLLGMAYENAKLIYQGENKDKPSASQELQEVLRMAEAPVSIECIDVSNLQGENPAVAIVHFSDETPLKSRYRLYHPRTVEGQDDFAMIYEAVTRRYSNEKEPPPDLLVVDGGKGQLASAIKALEDLKMELPICSLAKARTESAFTLKEVSRSEERIFLPNQKNPIILKEGHPALRLLQQVRDEAHRFSVKGHTIRRKNRLLKDSSLTEIEGIGEITRQKLLKHFGSVEKIFEATLEELKNAGLTQAQAEDLISRKTSSS